MSVKLRDKVNAKDRVKRSQIVISNDQGGFITQYNEELTYIDPYGNLFMRWKKACTHLNVNLIQTAITIRL